MAKIKYTTNLTASTATNSYDGIKMKFSLNITAVERNTTTDTLKVYFTGKSEKLNSTYGYPTAKFEVWLNDTKVKTWSNTTFDDFPSKPGSATGTYTFEGSWPINFTFQVKGTIGGSNSMEGTKRSCKYSVCNYHYKNGDKWTEGYYPSTTFQIKTLSSSEGDYWLLDGIRYNSGDNFTVPKTLGSYQLYDFYATFDKLEFTQCYIDNIAETSYHQSPLIVNNPNNVNKYQYSFDNTNWIDISSANAQSGFTVTKLYDGMTNLSPNTSYTIYLRALDKSGDSSKNATKTISIKTYAYPSITSYQLPTDYQNNGSFIFNNPLQRKIKIKVDVYNDSPRKPSGGTTPEIDDWLELIYEGTNTQNISNIFTAQDAEDMAFEHYDWFVKIPEPEWDSLFGDPYLKYTIFYTIDSNTWVSLLGESSDVYQNYNWSKSHPITVDNNKIANFITYIFSDYDSEARFSENNKDTTHLIPGKTTTMKVKLNSNSNPFTSPTITHGAKGFRPCMISYKFYIDNVQKYNFSSLDSSGTINIKNIGVKDQYAIKIIAYNSSNASAEIETSISVSNGKVVLYKQPFVTLNKVERTSAGFNITTNGSWITITGISSSPAAFTLQYAENTSGTPSWTSCDLSPTNLQLTKEEITVSGGLVFDKAYKFKLILSDKYGGTPYETSEYLLSGGIPILFIDSETEGVGVNCFPTGTGLYAKNINIQNSGSINLPTTESNINGSINFSNHADKIYMKSQGTGSNAIVGASSAFSGTRYNYLPAKGGTFAMTSDLPTVTSGTGSPTWDKGNSSCTVTYIKYGKIIFYDFNFQLEGQTDSGKNVYEGYWYDFTPAIASNSVGYYGARAIVCTWGSDHKITVRNAGATSLTSDTNEVHCRGVAYLQ